MKKFNLGPFLGAHTSIDARNIGEHNASDMQNVLLEDGRLTFRRGFGLNRAAQATFETSHGLEFVQGYSPTYVYASEFVSFERLSGYTSGKCRPFALHATTGARTELTTAAPAAVNLTTTGEWNGFSFGGYGYFCNPNEANSVQRYTVGNAASWVGLGIPASPATPLTHKVMLGGGSTSYTQLSFAGLTATSATHVACTGLCDTSGGGANTGATLDTSNQLNLLLKQGVQTDCQVTVDFNFATAGIQDFSNNDIFAYSFSVPISGFQINITTIEINFINNDGSPITIVPDHYQRVLVPSAYANQWVVRAEFKNKTRADWDNIRKIVFKFRVSQTSATTANNRLTIAKPVVGGVDLLDGYDFGRVPPSGRIVEFGYSYYNSTQALESGIGGILSAVPDNWRGQSPYTGLAPLGTHIQLTATVSADATVDNYRFYMKDDQGKWHRLTTQSDAVHTFTHKITYPEVLLLPEYTPTEFKLGNVKNGFPFKGWVIWLYQGGYQNVRHSRPGIPEAQAGDLEFGPEDPDRGATFSLADNNADEPLWGCQADDAALIVGNDGVYAQIGNRPFEMTPPKKLPGSFGCANTRSATRWSINGQPGIAALSRSGEGIYFYAVNSGFDGQTGYTMTELTQPVRKSLKDFLLTPQSLTNFSTANLYVEAQTDALWLVVGKRAMVLRRPSLVNGDRNWEFYNFTLSAVVKHVAVSPQYRMRWIRTDGIFDEVEYDNTNGIYYVGATRDGGSAPPTAWWTSKVFHGERRRAMWANVRKENSTDTPTITSIATNATAAKTVASGARFVKFGTAQTGWEQQYKVGILVADGYVSDVEITESAGVGERRRVS